MFVFGAGPVRIADVVAGAATGARGKLAPSALARIARSREVVASVLARSTPSYGLNTGLGGNAGFTVPSQQIEAFQLQLLTGRLIGIGAPLPRSVCRAALFCRIVELAGGATGASLSPIETLVALYDRGVTPVIPEHGSLGASDMGLVAHMVAVAVGLGAAWVGEDILPGAEALARVGLTPAVLAPKDGLGLNSHGSVTSAIAALALGEIGRHLRQHARVSALAFEGFRCNVGVLDPRIHAARPAAGQVEAAALLRDLLAGSYLFEPHEAVRVQDPTCFRNIAPVLGTALAAHRAAVTELECEINGTTCSPIVFADDGDMVSAPNYHASSLALSLDALGIALAHLGWACVLRICKMMTGAISGLPPYLSPVGGPSAGYVSLQKTAAALHAELKRGAMPAMLDAVAVSDGVEDLTPLTYAAARKVAAQLEPLRYLAAIEALVAAQAVDLRRVADRLAPATRQLHAALRQAVAPLTDDRAPGADVESARAVLESSL